MSLALEELQIFCDHFLNNDDWTGLKIIEICKISVGLEYSKHLKYLPAWRGQDAPKWWTP